MRIHRHDKYVQSQYIGLEVFLMQRMCKVDTQRIVQYLRTSKADSIATIDGKNGYPPVTITITPNLVKEALRGPNYGKDLSKWLMLAKKDFVFNKG